MKTLLHLLTSRYAVARTLLTALATLLASQAGNWFDNRLFGELSVFYTASYGVAILAKGGGDSVLTRALRGADDRNTPLLEYLSASFLRWLMALVVVAFSFPVAFGFSAIEVLASAALSAVVVTGNALRIALSPNFQIGYDNSTVTIVAILLGASVGAPVWVAGFSLFFVLGFLQLLALRKAVTSGVMYCSPSGYFSGSYMASEFSYFLLGFAAPSLMLFAAELDAIGAIRSVERIIFSGTFALVIVNNSLFHDFSHTEGSIGSLKVYFLKYCAPATLFYLFVLTLLALLSTFGFVPNIAGQPIAFALYGIAYLASVSCGPVSGALNFLGDERFVLISGLVGAVLMLVFLPFSILTQNPIVLVMGSTLGLIVTNLAQMFRLARRL